MKRKKMLLLSLIVFLLANLFGFASCDGSTLLNCGENGDGMVGENSLENPDENPDEGGEENVSPIVRELNYRLSTDGTYYIVTGRGTCIDSDIVIPDTYKGLPVTEIGKEAFYKCNKLTSVVIPDSVTAIGERGFAVCQKLESVQMSNSLLSIGEYAFIDCDALTSVYVSDIESWCNISFDGYYTSPLMYAKNLYVNNELVTELVIPDTITKIPEYAFSCEDLTSVVIPDSVTEIGDNAFAGCKELTRVEISDIGSWCNISFGNTDSNPLRHTKKLYVNNELLTEVIIPNTVKEIKDYAFYQCEDLTSLTIPNSVTSIGERAFQDCDRLTSLEISDSVTSIGERAFYWCVGLTSVVIGKSVTNIGAQAFQYCRSLVEVVNKSPFITVTKDKYSIGHVGNYALAVYNSADEFTSKLSNDSGYVIYTDGEEKILIRYSGTETSLAFPDYVTKIHKYAFANCGGLTSVVIGSLVTEIGEYAFGNCYQLVEVVNKSPFITVTKGSNENGYVGARALAVYDNEEEFISKVSNDNGYLVYTDGEEKILIGYNGTERNLVLPTYLTKINDNAFYDLDDVRSVTIGDRVTAIGQSAFGACDGLTSVVISDSVTSIEAYAFRNCNGLTSVVIPDSVTSIGYGAFRDCEAMTNVVINGGTVGFHAFEDCKNLQSVVIGDSVTVIETYAFQNCTKLKSVTFEQASNWLIYSNSTATTGERLSNYDLMDESTAAKYLTSTYYDEYWRRVVK